MLYATNVSVNQNFPVNICGMSAPQLALQHTLWITGGLLEASYTALDTQVRENCRESTCHLRTGFLTTIHL